MARGSILTAAGVAAATTVGVALVISPQAASAITAYFSTTRIVFGSGSVNCPSGWRVTGGGFKQLPNDSYTGYRSRQYQIRGSYPSGNGWTVRATQTTGSFSSSSGWRYSTSTYYAGVYAVCAR